MKSLSLLPLLGPRSTLTPSRLPNLGAAPPSLRHAPGSIWERFKFWLLAPAPHRAAPPLNRLPRVRDDFAASILDIESDEAERLRHRITGTRSLRELWHVRSEVFHVVGVHHSQHEAERRVALLNRHFPARAPRTQFDAHWPR